MVAQKVKNLEHQLAASFLSGKQFQAGEFELCIADWRQIITSGLISVLVLYQLISNLSTRHVAPDTPAKYGILAGTVVLTAIVLIYIPYGSGGLISRPIK